LIQALLGTTFAPEKSTRPLTVPEEFHFETEYRVRESDILNKMKAEEEEEMRKAKRQKRNDYYSLTHPSPFTLQSDLRASLRAATISE
jgi:hypothetical protein